MSNTPRLVSGYTLDALTSLTPAPVIAKRAPTTADTGYLVGTAWVYTTTNTIYFLTSVSSGLANWVLMETGGGAGTFSTLTVTTGPSNLAGSLTVATNITATTGNITAASGNVTAGGNLVAEAGSVTAGTSITATDGNITATDGNFVLSTAGTYVSLPGPVFIYSGAGAPSGALALHVGDLYVNTTAASATTRMYIATAAGTWTNITCAA